MFGIKNIIIIKSKPKHKSPEVIRQSETIQIMSTFLHDLTGVCGDHGVEITSLNKTDDGYKIDFKSDGEIRIFIPLEGMEGDYE